MANNTVNNIFDKEVESYEQKSIKYHADTCTISIEGQFTGEALEQIFKFVNSLNCSFTIIKGVN